MKFSQNVRMEPWIGKKYFTSNPRILILGESVYGGYITRNRIKNQIKRIRDGDFTYAYYTKLVNVFNLENKNYTNHADNESFWDSVCCYEYLTHAMKHPRQHVPKSYWEDAKRPFQEVCNKLRPDIVVCIGFETFDHMPNYGEFYRNIAINGIEETMEVWNEDKGTRSVYYCRVRHPAAVGFSNEPWFKLFRRLIRTLPEQ